MYTTTLQKKEQISPARLDYYTNEALMLSTKEKFAIQNYMDSEIMNPEVLDYIRLMEKGTTLLADFGDEEPLALNFHESITANSLFPDKFSGFKRLKKKIKQIFGKVVRLQMETGNIGIKPLMSYSISAMHSALGSNYQVVMPLLIGLIALFIKYGIDSLSFL